jgi:sugar O-acyltransferase (sialic acid O-acetyltransferase NeuD family)
VAVTFTHLNRARTRLFKAARALGYRLASYVSSRAFVWHNATVGANCFIFEGTVIQHHARIGDNVVLWSGCQILHRAIVGDNCFFSAGVVVAGYGEVEQGCFVGANSTVRDFGRVARDCFIGMAAAVVKPTEPEGVYVGNPARPFVPRLLPDTSDLVRRGIPAVARRRVRAAHTQQVSQ